MPEKDGKGGHGKEKFDPNNGRYTYDEETLKKIDKNFSVPYCKEKVLPMIISKLKEINPNNGIFDIYEMGFSEESTKRFDQEGIDFIMKINDEFIPIDLKTVFPHGEETSENINLSLFGYDKNVGADTNGYFLRQNLTQYYMFVLPKKILNIDETYDSKKHGDIPFEAFMVKKADLMDILVENFFGTNENVTSSSRSIISSNNRKIVKAFQKAAKNYVETKTKPKKIDDYDIFYDSKGRIQELSKTFIGKDGRILQLVLSLKKEDGKLRKHVFLHLDKKSVRSKKGSLMLNKQALDKNLIKHYFNI